MHLRRRSIDEARANPRQRRSRALHPPLSYKSFLALTLRSGGGGCCSDGLMDVSFTPAGPWPEAKPRWNTDSKAFPKRSRMSRQNSRTSSKCLFYGAVFSSFGPIFHPFSQFRGFLDLIFPFFALLRFSATVYSRRGGDPVL
jgi:hypothetical protein